jgi:hypothetical protein
MRIQTINSSCQKEPIKIGRVGEEKATQIRFCIPEDLAEYAYTVYVLRPRDIDSYPAAYITKEENQIIWTVSNVDTAIPGRGSVQIRFTGSDDVVKTMVFTIEISRSIDINTSPAPEWQESWLDALTELAETTHTNAENAAESERKAKISEDNAKDSEEAAAESERKAKTSEDNAKNSEEAAQQSEQRTRDSEQAAGESAEDAEAWAVGKRSGTDVSPTDPTYQNNSKWYAERSADAGGFAWFEVNNETGELMVTVTDKLAEDVSFAVNKELGTLEVTIS